MHPVGTVAYDDGRIVCDDEGLLIRRYYPWGDKRFPYRSVRSVTRLPLTGKNRVRRWRTWGSGDLAHWWSYDPQRPGKDLALVVSTGGHVRPAITPEQPGVVERILQQHLAT